MDVHGRKKIAVRGRIELDGDTASGRWYILDLGKLRDGSSIQAAALCHDDYVRTNDGWRLKRRSVEHIYKGDAAVDGWSRAADS